MFKKFSTVAIALSAVLVMGSVASAVSVGDADIFNGSETIDTTNAFGHPAISVQSHVVDGTNSSFVFADAGPVQTMSISGFNSAIDTLRFFDTPHYGARLAGAVKVSYSSTSQNSLDPTAYTFVGDYTLAGFDADVPPDGNNDRYTNPTTDHPSANDPATNESLFINYEDASGLGIPAGTQSILLEFSSTGVTQGLGISEIQAFAVPEPAGMMTLLVGAFSLMLVRRRA